MSSPSDSGLRTRDLVSEAWRIAVALPVSTGITALIVAAVCAFILSTTGQTIRAEQDVLDRIDEAGTRLISVFDDQGTSGLKPDAVERISLLSSVDWVIGLGYAADVKNAAIGTGGQPAAVRNWWGRLPDEIDINGRQPLPGEALVGSQAQIVLGFDWPIGAVDIGGTQLPVVGSFHAAEALAALNGGLLARPGSEQTEEARLRSIHVLAATPAQVAPLTAAVRGLLGAEDPTSIRFETSQTLAGVRAAVAGELGRFSRQLVLAALGVGLVLVAIVVYGSVTLRRQDFGRRRALGASRMTIVSLIAVQNMFVGVAGVVIGLLAGGMIVWRLTGAPPEVSFATAIAALAILTVGLATIGPAMIAAHRDPVRVLRVP